MNCASVLKHQRKLVGALYGVYLVVIVVALAGVMDLAITVMVCLSVHFAGLLGGLLAGLYNVNVDIYPEELGKLKIPIQAWDGVQAVFLGSLVGAMVDTTIAAAIVAIIGIVGCFYKVIVTHESAAEDNA